MPLDDSVVAAVTNSNFKAIGELGGLTAALMAQNAASHQRAMDGIREGVMAEALGQRAGADPAESVSQARIINSDLGRTIAELGAAVSSIQSSLAGSYPKAGTPTV